MNRKALIAAAVAAALGLSMLFLYMKRFEDEAHGGDDIEVVMAVQDIPVGTAITDAMVATHKLPAAYLEEARHIRANQVPRIIGVRTTTMVHANESLLWTDLSTTTDERRNLATLITPGMRAVTVRAGMTANFAGLLRPGDRVDVLLTTDKPITVGGATDNRVTITLLQSVLVLATGQNTGGEQRITQGRPGTQTMTTTYNQVTLSVRQDQVQVVAFAQDRGDLMLALRNPDDIASRNDLPETTERDILEIERRNRLLRREQPTRGIEQIGPSRP